MVYYFYLLITPNVLVFFQSFGASTISPAVPLTAQTGAHTQEHTNTYTGKHICVCAAGPRGGKCHDTGAFGGSPGKVAYVIGTDQ